MTKGIKGIEGDVLRSKVSFEIIILGIFIEGVMTYERIIEGANSTIQNFKQAHFSHITIQR